MDIKRSVRSLREDGSLDVGAGGGTDVHRSGKYLGVKTNRASYGLEQGRLDMTS